MKSSLLNILVITFCLSLISHQAKSQSGPAEKADKKQMSRWTLSQWLEQKNRMKLMDYWLSFNSPSPYEFYLLGNHSNAKTKVDVGATENDVEINQIGFGGFATIVGLEGTYENRKDDLDIWSAMFTLRLLGFHEQGTHLALHYGVRNLKSSTDELANQFAGASLNLYLLKFFGLSGHYRHYLEDTSDLGSKVSGLRIEGGGFIDFSFARLYGNWFSEKLDYDSSGTETQRSEEGIQFGLQLFF